MQPTDWTIKMNKKERRLALATALQSAAGSITVVEDIKVCMRLNKVMQGCQTHACQDVVACAQGSVQEAKTRTLTSALESWGLSPTSHTLLVVDEVTDALRLSSRNVPTLRLNASSSLSVYDILRADNIVIEGAALTYIQVWTAFDRACPCLSPVFVWHLVAFVLEQMWTCICCRKFMATARTRAQLAERWQPHYILYKS